MAAQQQQQQPQAPALPIPVPPSPKIAPPTPQEIQRKLGSPNELVGMQPSSSISSSLGGFLAEPKEEVGGDKEVGGSGGMVRRGSSGSGVSRRPSQSSSVTSDEDPPSPSRPNLALHSISEASSGSDVESSASSQHSTSARQSGKKSIQQGLEKLKLGHNDSSSSSGRLRAGAEGEKEMEKDRMSGYLMKKGERRKAWKKRWFVIRGGQLAMYKTDKEYQLLRLIPLASIHSCSPIEMKKHSFTFGIVTPTRTYYVQASSSSEVDTWCKTIDRARNELNSAATVTSLDTPAESSGQVTPLATTTNVDRSPEVQQQGGSKAIPMVPRSGTNAAAAGEGLSYASTNITTSPSPPTPFSPPNNSILSSSYTSNSNSTSPQMQNPTRVPPNSLATAGLLSVAAAGGGGGGGGLELEGVDDQLLRVQRGRGSSVTSSNASPMLAPGGSSLQSQGSYFGSSVGGQSSLFPPGSPGIGGGGMTSSEDEGDLEEAGGAGIARSNSMSQNPSGQPSGFGDPNKVILSGYLMKQGKRKNWRKRWFVLMSGRLVYSRSHMDTKVHRQIPLTRILDALENTPSSSSQPQSSQPSSSNQVASPQQGGQQLQHCFKIITPKRTYLVCAPSEEDEIKWLAALQCLVARKNTIGQTQQAPPINTIPATPPPPPQPSRSDSTKRLPPSLTGHGRQRSVTDAARAAVKDVERRFHPTSPGTGGK